MRMRASLVSLAILLAMTSACSTSNAQTSGDSSKVSDRHIWVNLGSGGASVPKMLGDDNGGISGGISCSYRARGMLLEFRIVSTTEFDLEIFGPDDPEESVWDIGAMYGRVAKSKLFMASAAVGIGFVGADGTYGNVPLHVGIPIEFQTFWTPAKFLGFGFSWFADVNSYKSFYGMLFCIQICGELASHRPAHQPTAGTLN